MVKNILQVVSWLTLGGIVVPPILFFMDKTELDTVKHVMLAATVVWFVITPMWMGRKKEEEGAAAS